MKQKICALLLVCIALSTSVAAESTPTAERILNSGGDAILTAKLTHFPYAHQLRSAVQKQDRGLEQLFRFTVTESFVGAGADTHCHILYDLLRFWGDRDFARILAARSPKVRTAVISALDYTWPYPGWQSKDFPATYRLAEHNTSYRQ